MLDSKQVKSMLSTNDIVKLCCHLQEDDTVLYDAQGHPIFCTSICHHGDSYKLYYYPETGMFHCYTCSDSFDIFGLVQKFKEIEFKDAFKFVVDFFDLRGFDTGENDDENLTDDWNIFQLMKDYETPINNYEENIPIPENLLEYFYPLAAPVEWQKDGITPEVMRTFGIRVDSALSHIIIPHRNVDGKLIGIRRRSYNPIEVEAGKKYMPVIVQGDIYRHSLGTNLYGLYENKHIIHDTQKVLVAESEKSVLQLASMYGTNQCWAVATCGSSFTQPQMNLLLNLGVSEIILGFDHEFTGGKGSPDAEEYEKKLLKIVSPLLPYVNVSVIMDYEGLTNYKDSPTDCGRDIFEQLYHQRVRLYTYDEHGKKTRKK
ncbi:MAG: hypothetical protein J6S67_23455 [Methanobrevibacter sp.]|nr:hypothetical protein [Methanobrevibacter sp.]